MTYTKPTVDVLGNASDVIEIVNNQKQSLSGDGPGLRGAPAYDLDE